MRLRELGHEITLFGEKVHRRCTEFIPHVTVSIHLPSVCYPWCYQPSTNVHSFCYCQSGDRRERLRTVLAQMSVDNDPRLLVASAVVTESSSATAARLGSSHDVRVCLLKRNHPPSFTPDRNRLHRSRTKNTTRKALQSCVRPDYL